MNVLDMKISQQIAEKATQICGYSVSIIDSTGRIIGSGDKSRINTIHGGIEPIFKERKIIEHDEIEVKNIPGAYEGVACPIIFNDEVIGAIGIRGNPTEVKKFMHLIKNQVEMMYQQKIFFQISQMKSQAYDLLFHELLSENNENKKDQIISLSRVNNLDLKLPRFAVMIEIKNSNDSFNDEQKLINTINVISKSIKEFLEEPQSFLTRMDGNHILLFKVANDEENDKRSIYELHQFLIKKHSISAIIGIGKEYTDFLLYKNSYQEAKQAINIANKMGKNDGVFHIEDLYVGRILSEVPKKVRHSILQDSFIKKLLLPENEILLETIYAFCENNLNISKTARELCVHRNTLLYRMERIQQLTGLDPTNFYNAMTIYLLLKLNTFN